MTPNVTKIKNRRLLFEMLAIFTCIVNGKAEIFCLCLQTTRTLPSLQPCKRTGLQLKRNGKPCKQDGNA